MSVYSASQMQKTMKKQVTIIVMVVCSQSKKDCVLLHLRSPNSPDVHQAVLHLLTKSAPTLCFDYTRPFTWCQTPKMLARNIFLVAQFGILWGFFFWASN
jgi:hypothetical protein